MKTLLNVKWGIFIIATLGLTSTLVQAQTTANGPYYATPSWDQTLPSSTRFIVLSNMNNDAVLDRETGLVWERAPTGSGTWSAMTSRCLGLKTGGRYGWRLPIAQELASLLDTGFVANEDPTVNSGPPLPAGPPLIGIPGIPAFTFYWTATSFDEDPNFAREVFWGGQPNAPFFAVSITQIAPKTGSARGWCVRGGLQPAPQ